MTRIALLSNPRSTGNRAQLPRIRSFCAQHNEIFHYEVEDVDQIAAALQTIARVRPQVLVINGGDGTVQSILTQLYGNRAFGEMPPPVAVLPNGKTNLIALDLGAVGDPIVALERVLEIARSGVADHVVQRELIALSSDEVDSIPVLGMFLGGAGLADAMLYCRNKVYPLGLSNGLSHVLTLFALFLSLVFGMRAAFLPPKPSAVKVSLIREGQLQGHFSLLIVTTLKKMLMGANVLGGTGNLGALQLMVVDQRPMSLVRAALAMVSGRLGKGQVEGLHVERGDEIRIEGRSSVILDGEIFQAGKGRAIVLRQTDPLPFLRLAA